MNIALQDTSTPSSISILSSPSNPTPSTTSESINSTFTDQTGSNVNPFAPNSLLWPIADYWSVAVPLTFATIILPLVTGPIFRMSIRASVSHTLYWRLFVATILTIYLACVYLVVPHCSYYGNVPYGSYSGYITSAFLGPLVVTLFSLYRCLSAFRGRLYKRGLAWLSFCLFSGACFILYGFRKIDWMDWEREFPAGTGWYQNLGQILIGAAPWVALVLASLGGSFWDWFIRRRNNLSDKMK